MTISDTGCGMDEETKSRAFEPFFTTKQPDKGTGLGLATVYAIVSQAGGHISIDTTPDAGSEFRIYLPSAEVPLVEETPPEGIRLPRGSETILVVEDEDMVRGLIANTAPSGRHRYDFLPAAQAAVLSSFRIRLRKRHTFTRTAPLGVCAAEGPGLGG